MPVEFEISQPKDFIRNPRQTIYAQPSVDRPEGSSIRTPLVATFVVIVVAFFIVGLMAAHQSPPKAITVDVLEGARQRIDGKTHEEAMAILDARILRHRLSENCSQNGYPVANDDGHFTPVWYECVERNGYRALMNRSPEAGLRYFRIQGPDDVVEMDPRLTDVADERYLDIAPMLAAFAAEK